MSKLWKKLIGDKAFYKMVLAVAVPIMIQNGITNFVGLLDNIMVGRIGTEQMSGIAIVNQLLFVYNLAIFGSISGAGIFSAQFYGCGDHKGVRHTFRFKFLICLAITLIGMGIFYFFGENLIMMYLHGEGNEQALEAALHYGKQYMWVMLFGLLPFGIEQVYTSTLRECGETMVPMKAGVTAVMVNLVLNFFLIFPSRDWMLGDVALFIPGAGWGVVGAAVATVISRYVQMLIVLVWTHRHVAEMPFIVGAYRNFRIPMNLVGKILVKGMPLLVNEIFWAGGVAFLNQCYSLRGLDVVAAQNISSTITNLFNVVFIALGSAISIVVGQLLGAGKMEEAKDTDTKMIAFSVLSCLVLGGLLIVLAPLFPMLYNTSEQVKELATGFLRVSAIVMPFGAFAHATYFTLRSGGKTIVTFLFDSVFMWVCSIPLAYILSRYTDMQVVWMLFTVQSLELIKCIIGFVLVKNGVWLQNIVSAE